MTWSMWMKVDKPRAGSFSFARRRHLFAVERRPLNSLWHVWWILWLRGSELRVKQRGQTDFSQLYCPEPNLGGYLRYFGCFLKVCPRAWWLFKIGGALLAWHIKVYQSSGVEGLLPLRQARVHKSTFQPSPSRQEVKTLGNMFHKQSEELRLSSAD